MRKSGVVPGNLLSVMATLVVMCSTVAAGAQTSVSSQASPAGTRANRNGSANCTGPDGMPVAPNASDGTCADAGPGFAAPFLEPSVPDTPRSVTALVRVDTVMKRPPVVLPAGNSFSVVAGATLIKVRRADQDACLATGKRISARVNAATSTTCLDHKGELLAIEECRGASQECTILNAEQIAQQQTAVAKP